MSTTYNPITQSFGNITLTGSSGATYGTSNAIYVGGGGGGTWTSATWPSVTATATPGALQVHGDAEFKGNVKVGGRDLTQWLEQVEGRLGMLQVNPGLESEFDELRALGDAYREAERRFLEQKRVYDILKTTDE
jgi:hypothetical protein